MRSWLWAIKQLSWGTDVGRGHIHMGQSRKWFPLHFRGSLWEWYCINFCEWKAFSLPSVALGQLLMDEQKELKVLEFSGRIPGDKIFCGEWKYVIVLGAESCANIWAPEHDGYGFLLTVHVLFKTQWCVPLSGNIYGAHTVGSKWVKGHYS